MTTITRESAEIKSFITGFLSDTAHDKQSSNSLLANVFRIALASLEAEPVAWKATFTQIDNEYNTFTALYSDKAEAERWVRLHEIGDFRAEITPLYAAPPAQVLPNDGVELLEEFVWTGEEWSVPLTGSEPEDDVPESFSASISVSCADDVEVWISVPPYMIIPYIEGDQDEDLFDTCAGALRISFLDLLKAYTSSCIREDAGDGVLYMANFFERMSKSLRKFYGTLPQEEIAAAKVDVDLVIPWERGGHEEGDK